MIVVLKNYAASAAEEMPAEEDLRPRRAPTASKIPPEIQPTAEQKDELRATKTIAARLLEKLRESVAVAEEFSG